MDDADIAGMSFSEEADKIEQQEYDDEVPLKVCMAISARKRYLEELEMSDSDKEDEIFGEPENKKFADEDNTKKMNKLSVENVICRIETSEEKRRKVEMEHAKLGIPIMTILGPSAGSIQPKSGVVRIYDSDWDCIPVRVTDINEILRDGHLVPVIEQFNITKEYRDWYQKALTEMFPRTHMEPRVVENIYGAKVELLKYFQNGSTENKQVS